MERYGRDYAAAGSGEDSGEPAGPAPVISRYSLLASAGAALLAAGGAFGLYAGARAAREDEAGR